MWCLLNMLFALYAWYQQASLVRIAVTNTPYKCSDLAHDFSLLRESNQRWIQEFRLFFCLVVPLSPPATASSAPGQQKGKKNTEQVNWMFKTLGPEVIHNTSIHIPLERISPVALPGWERGLRNASLPRGNPISWKGQHETWWTVSHCCHEWRCI